MSHQSINAHKGKTLKTFDKRTDERLEALVAATAAILLARVNEFAKPVMLDVGKRIADITDYYAKNTEVCLPPQRLTPPSAEARMYGAQSDGGHFFDRETIGMRSSDFGSAGSVLTKDVERGKHPKWTTLDRPFGGIENSCYGRELSRMGIREFANNKLVRVASIDVAA
ncbi:MAG: hypothetical protein ABJF23_27535 [Bryobacteraceae bacterium]